MALVIGHNRINYLWDSLKEYTVFSFPEYKTLDSLKEEEIYQVAPFFSNVVLVVGANDICYKTPEKIVDDVLLLCNTIRYYSPRATVKGRRDLQGVVIPDLQIDEKDRKAEEISPCHRESKAALHCVTWRKRHQCEEVIQNHKKCQEFWSKVVRERKKKGIEPALPPVNERPQVIEEYKHLLADRKPFFSSPV